MKKVLVDLFNNFFGVFVLIAVLIGAIVAFMFVAGFVIGGQAATQMAMTGKKFLDYAIKIAAVGVMFGLFSFYTRGSHELTLSNEQESETGETA
ncbi:Uncharacterized [Moorella glycerini]|uniref:Uncharacterized protein n=1 Tax=Neomoorella stamsii TaxID=1266720 RepID=A0A9X7J696_9FIRM|nr:MULTISPECIES: hypothetical protein [Moorella]PRR76922.1 hypothetical protein MOST_03780 [Moorella stamsii]CEP68544.1 Uncharacterized [Moorella glycerini]